MRVALTGATGFTGRFVSAALERAGATPVALTADLRDKSAVDREVDEAEFERVIHLAGHAFVDVADWDAFYTINQLGTFHLLDAVSRRKNGIRCIIASSAQVYGQHAEGLIAETAPVCPPNHYATSKYMMELGAGLWADQLDIVVTRPFNYTGVGQEARYLIPKIVDHFQRHAAVIELGNIHVRRDFGDVRSVADAYVGLAMAPASPTVVNISTGRMSSIAEIMEILTELSGHEMDIAVNPAFVRKNDVEYLGGDPTLLRHTLPDWNPFNIEDTLRWLFENNSPK